MTPALYLIAAIVVLGVFFSPAFVRRNRISEIPRHEVGYLS
jgi:hypothetical protein